MKDFNMRVLDYILSEKIWIDRAKNRDRAPEVYEVKNLIMKVVH